MTPEQARAEAERIMSRAERVYEDTRDDSWAAMKTSIEESITQALLDAGRVAEGHPRSGDGVPVMMHDNFYTAHPAKIGHPIVGVGAIGMEEGEDPFPPIVTVRDQDGDEFEAFDNELWSTREAAEQARGARP